VPERVRQRVHQEQRKGGYERGATAEVAPDERDGRQREGDDADR